MPENNPTSAAFDGLVMTVHYSSSVGNVVQLGPATHKMPPLVAAEVIENLIEALGTFAAQLREGA
ncbi:hypothetical protein [Nocardia salmonicida]|uniref:hypothetical protein n=1 Tax=Nocardia salmonicida TaxID=53431 RepID=UPI0007A552C5|nr:hypothetical protein [Nocardia salmonicida]